MLENKGIEHGSSNVHYCIRRKASTLIEAIVSSANQSGSGT